MGKHKAGVSKPKKITKPPKMPKPKKLKRISFVKVSVRKTPTIDKTTLEREYFSGLREQHSKHAKERKTVLTDFTSPTILTCPKCKAANVDFRAAIARSQDEDMVKHCVCRACEHRFVIR